MAVSTVTTDRTTARKKLQEFSALWGEKIDQWKQEGTRHTESSYAQTYWSGLLRCFGVIPERIDLFEQDATRATTGNTGKIDLFWSGKVLGEAKSLGKDLGKAEKQALDYLSGGSIGQHEFPRWVLVTDFENLRVTRLGEHHETTTIKVTELPDYVDLLMFLAGADTEISLEDQAAASILASKLMADIFKAMLGDEVDLGVGEDAAVDPEDEDAQVRRTSMWMTRLLFLLFGDDAGLWEQDLFYRFVKNETTPENLGTQLIGLFQVLNTPPERRRRVPESMARFPYVNGHLFEDTLANEFFTFEMRDALLAACRFNWSGISPAIFGSLFQLVKSKEARRSDGEHYTSEKNILKVLEPLFLDQLRDEARRLVTNKSTTIKQLRAFRDSLADMIFLDPACGCGNFLVVAYRELRKIETEIIAAIYEREGLTTGALDVTLDQRLSIGQFYGFEINWWPVRIAEVAMFLVDHQANQQLAARIGLAPERLPIKITAHIHHGNALTMAWDTTIPRTSGMTYVFGNPPFLGDHTRTPEQLEDLRQAWGGDKTLSRMDYVTGWHAKTLGLLRNRGGEFAFVTTNSITQGDQTARLFEPIYADRWHIKFAHRTFEWDSEAPGKAAVHCVIVGFTRDMEAKQRLWDYPKVKAEPVLVPLRHGINAYLVDSFQVLVNKSMKPISSVIVPATRGSMPTDDGNFIVEKEDYAEVAADLVAAKYLRPFRGARELVQGLDRWCLWMGDGSNFDPSDLAKSRILKQRVEAVAEFRAKSKAKTTREYPYHHLFRQPQQPRTDYVCVPSVMSANRRYFLADHYSPTTISSNANFMVNDPTGLMFGLLSSSMFITWQRAIGGRLKSDFRFASTLTWHTFPVPELTEKQCQEIIAGGKAVLEARELHPERSLADHYNPLGMDPALVKAHDKLDRAVDKALGATRKLTSEEQRLEILFKNYVDLTSD